MPYYILMIVGIQWFHYNKLPHSNYVCFWLLIMTSQVSRLLAMLYTLSPSNKALSMLSSSSSVLSESQWASFFHQASLGTYLNHQLVSRIGKHKDQNTTTDIHVSILNKKNIFVAIINCSYVVASSITCYLSMWCTIPCL